jgi:hypothetical protein
MGKLSYIKFLLNSANAHGVHSPFVFKLVTQCFYKSETQLGSAAYTLSSDALLYRMVYYFQPKTAVLAIDSVTNEVKAIRFACAELNIPVGMIPQKPTDFTYISKKQKAAALTIFEQLLSIVHNDSILVISHIHASPEMEDVWNTIKSHPLVTVTIDTFGLGIVAFRSEQEKEHFIIRPSKSRLLDAILGIKTLWGLIN